MSLNPFPKQQNFESSKLKEFADDNFKSDEKGIKLSKWVENTVAISPFSQCFQKACFPGASKGVIVWEWVNPFLKQQIFVLSKLKKFADDNFEFVKNGRKFS